MGLEPACQGLSSAPSRSVISFVFVAIMVLQKRTALCLKLSHILLNKKIYFKLNIDINT